jgi:hypothetical protein
MQNLTNKEKARVSKLFNDYIQECEDIGVILSPSEMVKELNQAVDLVLLERKLVIVKKEDTFKELYDEGMLYQKPMVKREIAIIGNDYDIETRGFWNQNTTAELSNEENSGV